MREKRVCVSLFYVSKRNERKEDEMTTDYFRVVPVSCEI